MAKGEVVVTAQQVKKRKKTEKIANLTEIIYQINHSKD